MKNNEWEIVTTTFINTVALARWPDRQKETKPFNRFPYSFGSRSPG